MRLVSAIYQDYFPFDTLPMVDECTHTIEPETLKAGDILVVWGGEDISPSLYNKNKSRATGADMQPSRRDRIEWALMQRAKELNIPIIGVCRGAQMLCALAGGFLIQDVNNHFGRHPVYTDEGLEIQVNSIHHQMMYPFEVDHQMLAHTPKLSDYHTDEDRNITHKLDVEPEFVYFPKVKGFAIQWHPEAMELRSKATQFVLSQVEKKV